MYGYLGVHVLICTWVIESVLMHNICLRMDFPWCWMASLTPLSNQQSSLASTHTWLSSKELLLSFKCRCTAQSCPEDAAHLCWSTQDANTQTMPCCLCCTLTGEMQGTVRNSPSSNRWPKNYILKLCPQQEEALWKSRWSISKETLTDWDECWDLTLDNNDLDEWESTQNSTSLAKISCLGWNRAYLQM